MFVIGRHYLKIIVYNIECYCDLEIQIYNIYIILLALKELAFCSTKRFAQRG